MYIPFEYLNDPSGIPSSSSSDAVAQPRGAPLHTRHPRQHAPRRVPAAVRGGRARPRRADLRSEGVCHSNITYS